MKKLEPRIISVSRRTDIPAFYAEWFMNRVRAGYCLVPNPTNPKQVSLVNLHASEVLAFVFWTRNPRPLMRHMDELDVLGFKGRYYFNFTLMNNPREIDANGPSRDAAIETFRSLSQKVGAERVIWRYDPIVLSSKTPTAFHLDEFAFIADQLKGFTKRCVISIVDIYKKAKDRLNALAAQGIQIIEDDPSRAEATVVMLQRMANLAREHGMDIQSCAEPYDLRPYGISEGKCIDDVYLKDVLRVSLPNLGKDKAQRDACGCVESREIGAYDTCLFGCQYCYATTSFDLAKARHRAHDPQSPLLFGEVSEKDLARGADMKPNTPQTKAADISLKHEQKPLF